MSKSEDAAARKTMEKAEQNRQKLISDRAAKTALNIVLVKGRGR